MKFLVLNFILVVLTMLANFVQLQEFEDTDEIILGLRELYQLADPVSQAEIDETIKFLEKVKQQQESLIKIRAKRQSDIPVTAAPTLSASFAYCSNLYSQMSTVQNQINTLNTQIKFTNDSLKQANDKVAQYQKLVNTTTGIQKNINMILLSANKATADRLQASLNTQLTQLAALQAKERDIGNNIMNYCLPTTTTRATTTTIATTTTPTYLCGEMMRFDLMDL